MFENFPSLLVTKLYIPRLRTSHVSRAHLLAALDAGLERRLVLVAAGAGFGKTSLLAEWSAARAEAVCWLALDDGDNDPHRFLSYLIASIQVRYPPYGAELLAALQSPQPPPVEAAAQSLINQLVALSQRLILVLDDFHVIENRAVHSVVAFLLDHLPPGITLVLLTRTDPPLPLARLRARGDLLELRAADLRFSEAEADRFLNQSMRLSLPTEAVQALDTRTEGWIAGLQLAALAMPSTEGDRAVFLRDFTGSHRFVLDYLMEEVLSAQPDEVRRFLLHTAVLGRLTAALCSVVTGIPDGQTMLDYLDRHNLFLIPLDGSRTWYRYHHLFADLLQARLQAEQPHMPPTLRLRAAHWHVDNNLPEEAIGYALAAGDFGYAAELMTGPAIGVMQRGEVTTLMDWYQAFPAVFIREHPRLALQFGLAFALNGRWDEAETLLNTMEAADEDHPEEKLLLAFLVASARGDGARIEAVAREAAAIPRPDPTTKIMLAQIVSAQGDMRGACDLLAEAQATADRDGSPVLALTALFHRCRFEVLRGALQQAFALAGEALERIHALGGAALPMATFTHTTLGRVFIEWNRLDEAANHLAQAIRMGERSGLFTGVLSSVTLMQAEVKQARGDAEGALRLAQEALAYAERYDPPHEVDWLKTYQARLWLLQGNLAAASEWRRTAAGLHLPVSIFYPANMASVTQARILLTGRKPDEAIAILTRVLAAPPDLLTVEAQALLALARSANGDSVHVLLALEQALGNAETENRIRVFLDLGYPMAKLLARFCESHPDHVFARKLLNRFPTVPEDVLPVDPLSDRELEVLRLIVAGQSNEEIAGSLTLALSTVKWYINVLYGKLHVRTRAQAIARAHDLNLLSR